MLHRLLASDEPIRCKVFRHAYRRQDEDPLMFKCKRFVRGKQGKGDAATSEPAGECPHAAHEG